MFDNVVSQWRIGMVVAECIHPELMEWIQRTIEQEKREKVAVDFKTQLHDGQWVWVRRYRFVSKGK